MDYNALNDRITAAGATLVAVSKTHPEAAVRKLYEQGQRDFGENRVKEAEQKAAALPADIRWHFIGHLQTNKVKYLAPFIHLIHAVDSERLLEEIDKQAASNDRTIDVLLQVKIAREDSKYGLSPADLRTLAADYLAADYRHARVVGLMGMGTFTQDEAVTRAEFERLQKIFEELRSGPFAGRPEFRELSAGMSGDFLIALEHGSTLVRIGSLLFGEREYRK
ncbi:MAG: YggS family pyridoxal phosphate-dependent enzyme [Saprospiraceae bacterium]